MASFASYCNRKLPVGVVINCDPRSEETSSPRHSEHDGLPCLSLRSLLVMTNTNEPPNLVIASPLGRRGDPLVSNNQTHICTRSPRHGGLPRRPFCPPHNDKAIDGRMTGMTERKSGAGRAWTNGTVAPKGHVR